jgi:hypothetical protein
MIYAFTKNVKELATPNAKGYCPICLDNVFSRCGKKRVWHWSHHKGYQCDDWIEPDTEWQHKWKNAFSKENVECPIKRGEEIRCADIYTMNKVVIILQEGRITKKISDLKEEYFGERMIWLIDGNKFKDKFRFEKPTLIVNSAGFIYDEEKGYGVKPTKEQLEAIKKEDDSFFWDRPQKKFANCRRPVFIDLGERELFWIKAWDRLNSGRGKVVLKKDFLNKYGGDFDKYR